MLTNITTKTAIAGRRLGEYQHFSTFPGHHHNNDMIVGYAVRETVRDVRILWHDDTRQHCGYDVAAVEGATHYADMFAIRDSYRDGAGYAVVDRLYSCGCRS